MSIQLNDKQLRELQLKELEGLSFFDSFCRSHGLTYYLCGGCLIGAVRSKGFVPWDDDIDVLMPRPDYEEFLRLYKKEKPNERFVLLDADESNTYGNIFAVLTDTNHTLVKEYQKDMAMPHGIPLDIFPIDGLASGKAARIIQYGWTMIYSLFRSGIVPQNQGGLLRFGSKVLLGIFKSKRLRFKLWKLAEKRMSCYSFEASEYVAELCAGFYFMKKVYPKAIYDTVTEVEFEGKKYFAMGKYDEYLKIPFGNYMVLPPEDERIAHHDIIELKLNEPSR